MARDSYGNYFTLLRVNKKLTIHGLARFALVAPCADRPNGRPPAKTPAVAGSRETNPRSDAPRRQPQTALRPIPVECPP